MDKTYIVSIDQSTQGTKALLFDEAGALLCRSDLPHRQIVNEKGWVSHDLNEIYQNTIRSVHDLIEKSGIEKERIAAVGISNQRETTALWDRRTGEPLNHAIVWQCGRAEEISRRLSEAGYEELIRKKTGIPLSGYFPASKMSWLLKNTPKARELAEEGNACLGTIDSWLLFRLTRGDSFRTDYSNASRTQLFNLETLNWDPQLCSLFEVPIEALATVADSDSCFGYTDFEGYLEHPIPIHGMLGDSHGALFGQGCTLPGMIKATYGTGSSLMMNIGKTPVASEHGVVTSIAWGMDGEIDYCLEGNLNYTGAVVTWLKDDLHMIADAKETQEMAYQANPEDKAYLVPAFTGLGAPYWDAEAKAAIVGVTRTTGQKEIVKAALECIAYQITDLIFAMEQDTEMEIHQLRVDGGPSRNTYLMQFQSDISGKEVCVPAAEELSGIGAAYAAGIGAGIYQKEKLFAASAFTYYHPKMEAFRQKEKYDGWKAAVGQVLTTGKKA